MTEKRIRFSDNNQEIISIVSDEGIELPDEFYVELLRFLSKACTYEEEELRIRPKIIIGTNVLSAEAQKLLQSTNISLVSDPITDTHLTKRLKSMLPFCNNGWRVFIDVTRESVTYGIMRNFNGPTGLDIVDLLMNMTGEELSNIGVKYVLIDVDSNFRISIKSNSQKCIIDFNLIEEFDDSEAKKAFCNDLLSTYGMDGSDKGRIVSAFTKVINLFPQKLHGSICVIVNHDYSLPDGLFNDGIFLETPVDIYSVLADDLSDKNPVQDTSFIISSHEKYHAFTGLLFEMLNIDGITVVDNKGRLRAYNVFVKSDIDGWETVSGGARRRAADYISKQNNPNYIGVYFQSQDGMSSYERINRHE